ncbi:4-alpha-glucanotransferase [Lacunisphaera limnophila]|uniref:4-alpha-glucanotransferase n=1 Tax=Lacunisphaera limnophila TaxID=1838286 RepID=A0A1D8AT17_9BACT|nr:4-alpha-glucanotransferase [Lacunisphaera limnophila]AOS44048.1 4-alpha-glucanotransferase [Lacunisphaera limnophila]
MPPRPPSLPAEPVAVPAPRAPATLAAPPAPWLTTRSAGVLAHLSSLPGEYGIGNLGRGARAFVDFLAESGVRYWQICPIGPTGFGDSPYQLFSASAGNPYFIDLGELVTCGLLTEAETAPLRRLPAATVDYGWLYADFWRVLALAADRFAASGADTFDGFGSYGDFRRTHATWLQPYADFMALKGHFGGWAWPTWPAAYARWTPALHASLPASVRAESERHAFYQYLFFGQWDRLRAHARDRGVGLIGDVPIFVALDSADTWRNRAVFRLDASGRPLAVAGVPPDYFSALGQLWGNPLYDWAYLRETGYAWWLDRLRAAFELYDVVRLDHFRGFDTFWEIPADAPDARTGAWRRGPGLEFFSAVRAALPGARIIAEDLGYIGPDVVNLRRAAGLPGMKILQFAYGHDANNANLPHFYPPDSVAYTGTHDNITARGWLESLQPPYAAKITEYFGLDGTHSAWPVIRATLATVSRLAVIPVQDLLDLPASATLNRPGTTEGNWQWRFTAEQLGSLRRDKAAILRHWISLYDRTGDRPVKDFSEPPEAT